MDNYITPAAQAVGRGLQTAAPYAENIAGLLASIPLAAYEIGQPGGSPLQFLANRQAMLQDPGFRSMAGPFLSGLFDVTGGMHPGAGSAAEAQRAGLSPEQAAQMGVQVLGPGQPTPPPQWMPNLPPPSPERQLQSESARAALQLFPQLTKEQQAETLFGVKPHVEVPPGWIPTRMNTGTGGVTFQAPGATPGAELKPAMAGGQEVPGLFQTPRGGFIRDPRFKGGTAGGEVKTPFQLWRETHPKGTIEDWQKSQAAGAQTTALAKPLSDREADELGAMQNLTEQIAQAEEMLKNPEVEKQLGVLAGRKGFAEYKLGFAQNPMEDQFTTLRELIRLEAVGRLARMSGTRAYRAWREINIHPPQAGDQPALIRDKLKTIKQIVQDAAAARTKLMQTPRGKAAELFPPTGGAPPTTDPNAPARGGMTPGGIEWQVLE